MNDQTSTAADVKAQAPEAGVARSDVNATSALPAEETERLTGDIVAALLEPADPGARR